MLLAVYCLCPCVLLFLMFDFISLFFQHVLEELLLAECTLALASFLLMNLKQLTTPKQASKQASKHSYAPTCISSSLHVTMFQAFVVDAIASKSG